jgi:hypothetical protein
MYEGREICRVFPDGGACIGYSNALFLQKIPCSTVMVISLDEVNEDTSGHPAALRNGSPRGVPRGGGILCPSFTFEAKPSDVRVITFHGAAGQKNPRALAGRLWRAQTPLLSLGH